MAAVVSPDVFSQLLPLCSFLGQSRRVSHVRHRRVSHGTTTCKGVAFHNAINVLHQHAGRSHPFIPAAHPIFTTGANSHLVQQPPDEGGQQLQ